VTALRVFQVASGNVGTEMIERIINRFDLELVGLHRYTPDFSSVAAFAGHIARNH